MPDQSGRTAIVTGANSGLGFETARALAGRGAQVVMACRDAGRAADAAEQISREHPKAALEVVALDLASLASVRAFAETFRARELPLHVLCNNAGVMAIPRRETADGFEMQLGTNHLGHFALTGLLLDALLASGGARVVSVSSLAHRVGRMRFGDLQRSRGYGKWTTYAQSKLANLLFTFELQRRADAVGAPLCAAACHPGYSATNLQFAGARMLGSSLRESGFALLNRVFAQSAEQGALPALYAATAEGVRGGDYFGPGGLAELWGPPKRAGVSRRARDTEAARRLWQASEELTGVRYTALETGAADS